MIIATKEELLITGINPPNKHWRTQQTQNRCRSNAKFVNSSFRVQEIAPRQLQNYLTTLKPATESALTRDIQYVFPKSDVTFA